MLALYGQIEEAVAKIKSHWDHPLDAGIILGTGLGSLAEHIEVQAAIEYDEVHKYGGGIRCNTMQLIRDPGPRLFER